MYIIEDTYLKQIHIICIYMQCIHIYIFTCMRALPTYKCIYIYIHTYICMNIHLDGVPLESSCELDPQRDEDLLVRL